jgi:phosphoribosylamine--glycine ligase
VLDDATRDRIVREIIEPTLQGCRDEGFPFRGILFIGLMLTNVGPQVLEYNVRFGDPETQAILVRLNSDLSEILRAIDETRLGDINIDWSQDSSACVVLAAPGYPAKPETGALIRGLASAEQHEGVAVFHAATARNENGEWLTAGGRVLGVTAVGEDLNLVLSRCYEVVDDISWDGMHYRRDIGRPRAPGLAAGS